ncbi:DUF885 family protein [Trebonia kvetii]|uniref:DUF885 family protein n=1 Tax=Trebonia kvetii TaxID=2480626 RepID=A0A6P2C1A5_9ACTN|nr:DUF885 family protein [Trebonia kvetii]
MTREGNPVRELDDLAARFWAWRARQQPRSRDDIPRLDRPRGWLPETDPDLAGRRYEELQAFRAELGRIRPDADAVPDRVDHRLLRSAIARVTWESDTLRVRSVPRFWTDQAIGPVFDALLRPGVDEARVTEVVRLLRAVPATLGHAPAALAGAAREFAELALGELDGIRGRLDACTDALAAIAPAAAADLRSAAGEAAGALEAHASWLAAALTGLAPAAPVGPERYEWFLREVACVPLTIGEIDAIGRREYDRAVWLELVHRHRNRNVPEPPLPATAAGQCAAEDAAEASVRAFYEREDLLSQPAGLGRYLVLPMPAYLEPLRFLGMTDELTGPGRLDENGVAYVPEPGPHLPYFYAANARDPRAGIIHEGVHYQQLALSWRNPRPVRRHYYDSGANEGIAFYNEELMLAAGLLDDAPHTRAAVCNFMRLRALRVTVDVGLATGALSIADAAAELTGRVPMDAETAAEEAAFFAESPGQALTYQIGKSQLIALLADAARVRGAGLDGTGFDLRELHDAIWVNGNVPIALLRWELLGLTDELPAIGVDD